MLLLLLLLAEPTCPTGPGLLCLYLLLHLHIMQSLSKDEFTPAFIIFTISRLEYKILNLSRLPKYCFASKTCCYLENPNYQPPLNTLNYMVQLWFDSMLYNIHSKRQIPMFYMFRKLETLHSLFFLKQNYSSWYFHRFKKKAIVNLIVKIRT